MQCIFEHVSFENIDSSPETWVYGCLASQHGLGAKGFYSLLECYGSPQAVYGGNPEELRKVYPRLTGESADSIAKGPVRSDWERLCEACGQAGFRVTAPGWSGYPAPLLDLESPPPLLYIQGEWDPADLRAAAVVGTRTPTAYGREAAFVLARDLAGAGVAVVSGFAVGIDAAAHAGALEGGGRTLAVIGCGLDIPYPRGNLELRARIAGRGAVLSEHPPGTPPLQMHFPRRNRLISALARATVVVEAGSKSGALLTALHALHQGRPLFSVPGPIFSRVSSGTNTLLRKGALLASSAADVLAVLEAGAPGKSAGKWRSQRGAASASTGLLLTAGGAAPRNGGNGNLVRAGESPRTRSSGEPSDPVLRLWDGDDEACPLDRLAQRARERKLWPLEEVSASLLSTLLNLELRGLVERLPGPAFRRVSSRL